MTSLRIAFVLDLLMALVAGGEAMLSPASWHARTSTMPLPDAGLDQVRLLGTVYVNYAILVGFGLVRGSAGWWRVFLPAAALGDLVHLVFFAQLLARPDAVFGLTAVANLVYVAIYVPLKLYASTVPERVAR